MCHSDRFYIPPTLTKLPKTTIITAILVTTKMKTYKIGFGSFFNLGKINLVADIPSSNVVRKSINFILTTRSIAPLN